jgi:hypothetical protein
LTFFSESNLSITAEESLISWSFANYSLPFDVIYPSKKFI